MDIHIRLVLLFGSRLALLLTEENGINPYHDDFL
jgi:hypothetical protein